MQSLDLRTIGSVLGSVPAALLVVDEDGRVVEASRRAEELLARPRAELVGRAIGALLPDGLPPGAGARGPAGVRAIRGDGREIPVDVALGAVATADGPVRIVDLRDAGGERPDALERRAHQQAAVAALGRRALAGGPLEPLVAEARRLLARVLGVERADVFRGASAAPDAAVVTAEPAGGISVPMLAGGRALGVVSVQAAKPREFAGDDVFFVQSVANVLAAAIERRRAEEALERTSSRLQSVMDASPAAIYLKDRRGRLLLVNRHFERLFGLAPGRGVDADLEAILGPEPFARLQENDARVLTERRVLEFEERLPIGGEERVFISLKFPLLEGPGDEPVGIGGISTDISERVRMETRLARVERLESVGLLAGGVAHDFNNLLAVILASAGFLADAVEPGSQAAADVEQILRTARQASDLTRRLLLFSRREPGNPQVVDVAAVIADTALLLGRTLGEHIELETDVEDGLWHVRADRGQLEQVLTNLVINARDAMFESGRLRVEARNVVLPPGGADRPGGEVVRLAVSDTGTGMPPDVAARAFEPFFSTKPAGHGSGLGLSTVYGIVTSAGGHIDLRSTPGRGTTVEVHLPAVRDGAAAAAEPPADAAPRGSGERVLLVEDKEAVRLLSTRILESGGYTVVAASDGAEALEVAATEQFDALVTDVVMPRLSGPEAAEFLRQARPGLPVVFVSGYTKDAAALGAAGDPATTLVEKPFTADALLTALRGVLDAAAAAAAE